MVGNADHRKEKHIQDTMQGIREIDGFLIDAVGSETEHIGGKTCATEESELSIEGSSVRIEQGNIIMIIFHWLCALIVDLVTQRNRS